MCIRDRFTVASYLVEGRPNRTHPRTHELMHDDPQAWEALLEWVAEVDIAFLRAQVLAGACLLYTSRCV